MGNVTIPVDATFAEAEPDIDPNKAETKQIHSTLSLPAAAAAIFMNPCPASPALSIAPKMTNTETIDTDTPVRVPHRPPSVIIKVPKKQ